MWGKDVNKANELGLRLEAGTVWINDHLSPTGGPFGGFKQSGIGRELSSVCSIIFLFLCPFYFWLIFSLQADVATYTECQTVRLAK